MAVPFAKQNKILRRGDSFMQTAMKFNHVHFILMTSVQLLDLLKRFNPSDMPGDVSEKDVEMHRERGCKERERERKQRERERKKKRVRKKETRERVRVHDPGR
jgi:hypothetical protein